MSFRRQADCVGRSFPTGRPVIPVVLSFVAGWTLPVMHPWGAVALYAQAPPALTVDRAAAGTALSLGNNGLLPENWSAIDSNPLKRDEINTMENVFIENPEVGQWTIAVSADEIVQDGHVETTQTVDADFGLVVSGVMNKSACCLPPFGVCRMYSQARCAHAGGVFHYCESCGTGCEATQGPQQGP